MTQKRLLKLAQGPKRAYPKNQNVVTIFESIVKKYPRHTAIEYLKDSICYHDLNVKANQLAHHLIKIGIKPHDFVGIYLEPSIHLIIAILAILKAGAVYVPIDASYPMERKLHMLEDTKLKFLITSRSFAHQFPKTKIKLLFIHELKILPSDHNINLKIHPLDLAYITYTSGTTGMPKGVQILHRGILRLVKNPNWIQFSHKDRFLQISNISFDAFTQEVWGALLNGATLCIYSSSHFSPQELGSFIVQKKISQILFTSRLFTLMAEEAIGSLKNVHTICVGGDVMSAKHAKMVLEKFPLCHLINEYGPAENTTCSTAYIIKNTHDIEQAVPIGHPISNSSAYVLDEHQKLAKFGEIGELYVGGDGLAKGYLRQKELTHQKFIKNPFGKNKIYKTGDLASYLPDGNLLFLGRIDTQVKIRGFRIELSEIEAILRSHPLIKDCVAVVFEKNPNDKQIIVYVEKKPKAKITPHELMTFAASHLAYFMIPNHIVILKKIPLTPHGKVDKKSLPLPTETSLKKESCKTKTEKQLQKLWMHILHQKNINRNDNFFEKGGDSILVMTLSCQIDKTFKMSVPIRILFEEPILQKLAKKIDTIKAQKKPLLQKPFSSRRKKEAILDPLIHAKKAFHVKTKQYTNPEKIFLTGATGLVGSFFLKELLETTKAHLYCLVRGESEEQARFRLIKTCKTYLIWKPEYEKRITVLPGSLDQPLLGLQGALFQHLSEEIDAIFHIGAFVNHAMSYEMHKGANVLGTQEVLRLSCTYRLKPCHIISSLSVLEDIKKEPISENAKIDQSKSLPNGYVESKWVAEKLALIARSRGLLTTIFRLPRVGGDSKIGSGPIEDFLWRLVQASIKLKKAPLTELYDDLTPVDYICKAIQTISKQPKWINSQFHVISPYAISYNNIFTFLQTLGYPLKWVDFVSWKNNLLAQAMKTKDPNLQALSSLLSDVDFSKPLHQIQFSSKHLQEALKKSQIQCAKIDAKILKKYIDYYIKVGFLPKHSN